MPRKPYWTNRARPTLHCACGYSTSNARYIELHAATCRWKSAEWSGDSSSEDSDGHWQDASDSESEESRDDREAAACQQHFYAWYLAGNHS